MKPSPFFEWFSFITSKVRTVTVSIVTNCKLVNVFTDLNFTGHCFSCYYFIYLQTNKNVSNKCLNFNPCLVNIV